MESEDKKVTRRHWPLLRFNKRTRRVLLLLLAHTLDSAGFKMAATPVALRPVAFSFVGRLGRQVKRQGPCCHLQIRLSDCAPQNIMDDDHMQPFIIGGPSLTQFVQINCLLIQVEPNQINHFNTKIIHFMPLYYRNLICKYTVR